LPVGRLGAAIGVDEAAFRVEDEVAVQLQHVLASCGDRGPRPLKISRG
jgi:hypothetical protein